MVALFEKALGDGGHRGHATSEHVGGRSTFQRSQVLLQARARGVGDTRVFVAFVLSDVLLDVSGGSKNRNGDRAGRRIRFLADMNGLCGKSWFFLFHLYSAPPSKIFLD